MPATGETRRNIELLTWIRAGAFIVVTTVALASMPVLPVMVTTALAVGVGAIALLSPPAAVIAFVAVTATILATGNLALGALLLLAGVSASPWLARDGATRFFLVVGPVLLTLGHAEWAPIAVAGFLLGAGEGAGTAVAACLIVEMVGLAIGRPALGADTTGGTASMVHALSSGPLPSLSVETFAAQVRGFEGSALPASIMQAKNVVMLLVQPMVWGVGAAAAGVVGAWATKRGRRLEGAGAAAAVGIVVVTAGTAATTGLLHSPVALGLVAITGVVSLVVAETWLLVWEGFFAPVEAPASESTDESGTSGSSIDAAPVDALLGQLAIAARRPGVVTTRCAVLAAEVLPIPAPGSSDPWADMARVFEAHGARGTSGHGALVAAFDSASAALSAASEGLRAHHGSNAGGVRIAVAAGDTLLDIYRRPVGGPALIEACAVLAMAGSDQILTTAATVAQAPEVPHSPLGPMTAATLAEPLELVAIRWALGPVEAPEPVPAEASASLVTAAPTAGAGVPEA